MPPLRGAPRHAQERPDHPAVVVGDRTLTYRQLDDRARRLAGVLRDLGAGPERPVACILPNGAEPLEVALAASMAGAPYLPVNWHLKAAELRFLLEDAEAGAVVGHASLADELAGAVDGVEGLAPPLLVGAEAPGGSGHGEAPVALARATSYEDAIASSGPDPSLDAGPGPQLVFYTSGTTSRPKGVVHGGLGAPGAREAAMEGQAMLWGWGPGDVYVLSGPAYHASHGGWALTALLVGATTVVLPRFTARAWLEAVHDHRGTRSFMVPAHFIRLLELPEEERRSYDTSSLRLIVHGAAPCPVEVKRRMMATFPSAEIHELYGASEGGATRISPQEWLERPGSVGRPWPGVEVKVLDESGRELPPGEQGVIWIRPPQRQEFVYRNDPEATRKAWRDGAFTVGDVGMLDGDGYLTITDRLSDMILWGGVNISPREIEEAMFEHPAVVDCAVFGIPHERDGEHIKALVQLSGPVTTDELAEHVRSRLADYKVPHAWEVVDEVPRDPNGKVVKRHLRAAHGA